MDKKQNRILRLTESGLMVAIATLLSIVTLFSLPQGGEVTLCATLPLVLVGYRYGVKWGFATCFVYAIIQLLLGLKNVSYAETIGVALLIILLDYLIPYTVFGLSGLFRGKKQIPALCGGLLLCTALRYVSHVVVGYVVWGQWAGGEWLTALCSALGVPESGSLYLLLYSLGYNSFVFVDMAIAMVVAVALSLVLDLSRPGLPRVRRREA